VSDIVLYDDGEMRLDAQLYPTTAERESACGAPVFDNSEPNWAHDRSRIAMAERQRKEGLMKIFLSIALGAVSIMSTATLAPVSMMAQAPQPVQPAPVQATAASLETKLDTKTAKVGDVVSAKLSTDATVGAAKFPSGSHLLGKITDVQPSTLVVLFDSVQVKKAAPVPTHATLAAIAGPYDAAAMAGGGGADGPSEGGAPAGPGPNVMTALGSSIKNITLTPAKTTDTSGTISGTKDFKLDKGTRLWFGLF
jgi:hypothetical protein